MSSLAARLSPILIRLVAIGLTLSIMMSPALAQDGTGARERLQRVGVSELTSGFLENRGQLETGVAYAFGSPRLAADLRAGSFMVTGPRVAARPAPGLDFAFVEASSDACLVAAARLPGVVNYYLGADPDQWVEGVRRFAEVEVRGLQEGVDVRWRRDTRGRLEYDLVYSSKATRSAPVRLRVEAPARFELREEGRVLVTLSELGELTQSIPLSWVVDASGQRERVTCRFELLSPNEVAFVVPVIPQGSSLVLDPALEWSSFFGGSQGDSIAGIDRHPGGDILISGNSWSTDLPTTPGAYATSLAGVGSTSGGLTGAGVGDAFVARISPGSNTLQYCTFLGGSLNDDSAGVVIGPSGAVTIAGWTDSSDWPVTAGSWTSPQSGQIDAYAARLDGTLGQLVWSAVFGGGQQDFVSSLGVDEDGGVFVAGRTSSNGLPTTPGVFMPTVNPLWGESGFVIKLNADGASLGYATYVGSPGFDRIEDLAVDAAGNAVVTGNTSSNSGFQATAGAFQAQTGGGRDAIVVKLDQTGGAVFATFLGIGNDESGESVDIDASGNITVAGRMGWSSFSPPTPVQGQWPWSSGGYIESYPQAFVTRLDPTGSSMLWSLGFAGTSAGNATLPYDLRVEPSGNVVVAGITESSTFSTTAGALGSSWSGFWNDAFVSRFSVDGSQRLYSSYIGEGGNDLVRGLVLDPGGSAWLAGMSTSANLPMTPNALQPTVTGNQTEGFIYRMSLMPLGLDRFGVPTPGCLGPSPLFATTQPTVGNQQFGIQAFRTAPSAPLTFAVSSARLSPSITVGGIGVAIDPLASGFALLPLTADANGDAVLPLPLPAAPALVGAPVNFQALWFDACAASGLAATNALGFTIQ